MPVYPPRALYEPMYLLPERSVSLNSTLYIMLLHSYDDVKVNEAKTRLS